MALRFHSLRSSSGRRQRRTCMHHSGRKVNKPAKFLPRKPCVCPMLVKPEHCANARSLKYKGARNAKVAKTPNSAPSARGQHQCPVLAAWVKRVYKSGRCTAHGRGARGSSGPYPLRRRMYTYSRVEIYVRGRYRESDAPRRTCTQFNTICSWAGPPCSRRTRWRRRGCQRRGRAPA